MAEGTKAEQYGFNIIADSNGDIGFIASNPRGAAKSSPKHREIAQRIVERVNNHERLVEALERCTEQLLEDRRDDKASDAEWDAVALLAELDKGDE